MLLNVSAFALLLIPGWVYASPITTMELGELPYYKMTTATSMHTGAFSDEWKFSVPRTAEDLGINFSSGIVYEVDLFKGNSLLVEKTDGLNYSFFIYSASDPIQLSYTADYVSSLAGDYSLWVYSYPRLTGYNGYDINGYVNPNTYIPSSPIPEPGTGSLIIFGAVAYWLSRGRARVGSIFN